MAVLSYNRQTDVYDVQSVNVENGAPNDMHSTPRNNRGGGDGFTEEEVLRRDYPILCSMYLDGFSRDQVARSYMWSMETFREEFDIELYSLHRDERSTKGPGHVVLSLADARNIIHYVASNRPSPSW